MRQPHPPEGALHPPRGLHGNDTPEWNRKKAKIHQFRLRISARYWYVADLLPRLLSSRISTVMLTDSMIACTVAIGMQNGNKKWLENHTKVACYIQNTSYRSILAVRLCGRVLKFLHLVCLLVQDNTCPFEYHWVGHVPETESGLQRHMAPLVNHASHLRVACSHI